MRTVYSVVQDTMMGRIETTHTDLTEALDLVRVCLANEVGVVVTPYACEHPGLFASDPPSGATYGTEEYDAWLDSTKRCRQCNGNVPMRDL